MVELGRLAHSRKALADGLVAGLGAVRALLRLQVIYFDVEVSCDGVTWILSGQLDEMLFILNIWTERSHNLSVVGCQDVLGAAVPDVELTSIGLALEGAVDAFGNEERSRDGFG